MRILAGDCLVVMGTLGESSVDAIVTDPPYGLEFMGKEWDHGLPGVHFWEAALRVAKPGAHLLAFGGTRTFHRLACAIEDAGWEIRDCVMWVYGSGFPKSLDVSKAIDKMNGAAREVVGSYKTSGMTPDRPNFGANDRSNGQGMGFRAGDIPITAPSTAQAKQWQGWGTALKPAWEPIIVARKPLIGTVAENVLEYGTGGINVDGGRVGTNGSPGRWPANLIHDGSDEVLAGFPRTQSGDLKQGTPYNHSNCNTMGAAVGCVTRDYPGDSGSASRFFYTAKASKKDRDEGCEELTERLKPLGGHGNEEPDPVSIKLGSQRKARNNHPTVKPTSLMRYLCKLVTPPGGVILDPFMGSGSTGKAARLEGFDFIGIEKEEEYVKIAEKRIEFADGLGLS